MLRIAVLTTLLAATALAKPQYEGAAQQGQHQASATGTGGNYDTPQQHQVQTCTSGWDCIHKTKCIDGWIDTTGAGQLDLRIKGPSISCTAADHICCQIPTDFLGESNTIDTLCSPYEDCVQPTICKNGYINTDGAGLVDLRKKTDYRKCFNKEYNEAGVCCRVPDAPPVANQCAGNSLCTDYSYCDKAGIQVQNPVSGYVYTGGRDCYTSPGQSLNVGVCCQPPLPPIRTQCPVDSQCTPKNYCDVTGVITSIPISGGGYTTGEDCYIKPGSPDVGVCCAIPKPLNTCPTGSLCTPYNYCDAKGIVVKVPHSGASYTDGKQCYISPGTGTDTGVCCAPPVPLTACPGNWACTARNYCDGSGKVVTAPYSGAPYAQAEECYMSSGSQNIGICCLPAPVVQTCPAGSVCTAYNYCDGTGTVVTDIYNGARHANAEECYLNAVENGVCCKKPTHPIIDYITCPINSECIPEDFCFGEFLEVDTTDSFYPYSDNKVWGKCSLPGDVGAGICCRNPLPTVPNTCGVSHYANSGDNLKTRFYPTQLTKLEADFGEMPWQAIVFFSNYTFKCGASLISDRHLLTVGHCVYQLNPYDIRIRLGEWQVNTFDEPLPYQDLDVAKIIIHPDFNIANVWNNIAIIELKESVNLQYNINNICLPFGNKEFPSNTRCFVSGWGKDSFEGSYQHILKKIDLPLIDHHDCQALLRKTRLGRYFRLHDSYRCAGGEPGKDACVGDGGGPLICLDHQTNSYVQVGITAWGIGCGQKDVPGAYTNVNKFIPWISTITGLGASGPTGNYGK